LAGSSVKIAARDVLATWKILVALVFAPTLYGFYSFLVFIYLWSHNYQHSFALSLAVWVLFPVVQYVSFLVLESSIDIYR
jgi:glycerol-3-phosphate O-acyltransferase/dihydroxyacetone phosphate acyltransferase